MSRTARRLLGRPERTAPKASAAGCAGGLGWKQAGRGMIQHFMPDYPGDHRIYFTNILVVGVRSGKQEAVRLFRSSNVRLEIVHEPRDDDIDAIAVYWVCDEGRAHIGYIPADIAARIAGAGIVGRLRPRLHRVFVSPEATPPLGNCVEVWMQLTGPKADSHAFFGAAPKRCSQVRPSDQRIFRQPRSSASI